MDTETLIGILDACKSRGVSSVELTGILKVSFFDEAVVPVEIFPAGGDNNPLNNERSILERVAARSIER